MAFKLIVFPARSAEKISNRAVVWVSLQAQMTAIRAIGPGFDPLLRQNSRALRWANIPVTAWFKFESHLRVVVHVICPGDNSN